jgi:hypothetical protein
VVFFLTVFRFHRCSILGSPDTGAVGRYEAAVARDLFLPHSVSSYVTCFLPLVPIVLGTRLRYRVRLGFDSRQGHRSLSSYPSRLSLGLADPPLRWEHRTLSGVKRPEHGADHSSAPSECREEECVDLRRKFTHIAIAWAL